MSIKSTRKYRKVIINIVIVHLKYPRLFLAIHLPKNTQWWSMLTMHTPQTPQWWVSGLLSTTQCLHLPIILYCLLLFCIIELLIVYVFCLFSIVTYFLNTSSEIPGFNITVWMQLYAPIIRNMIFKSLNLKNEISDISINPDI